VKKGGKMESYCEITTNRKSEDSSFGGGKRQGLDTQEKKNKDGWKGGT